MILVLTLEKLPLRDILRIYAPDAVKKMNVKVGYGMDLVSLWNSGEEKR